MTNTKICSILIENNLTIFYKTKENKNEKPNKQNYIIYVKNVNSNEIFSLKFYIGYISLIQK